MKTQTKTIAVVLAVFLVAALFMGAASAREVTPGKDAFVYETINFSGSTNAWVLNKMSGDATPVVLNSIQANSNGEFNLLEASVGTYTGAYQINDTTNTPATSQGTVNIWYPELTLKAYLNGTTDSIDGKTIEKQTEIKFLIESPKVGPANIGAQALIYFTTPVGAKTTNFGGIFENINIDASQVDTSKSPYSPGKAVTAGTDAAAGTYVAQAQYNYAGFMAIPDKYKKSNAVSFTVQSTSLTLTANKDSVVRSNPYTVVIQGESKKPYFLFIERIDVADGYGWPTLQPNQDGSFSGTSSGYPANLGTDVLCVQGTTPVSTTFGFFNTDASGKRTIQFNTEATTDDQTYTMKVYRVNASDNYNITNDYDKVKVKVEKGAVTITATGDRSYYIGQEIKLTGTNTDSSSIYLFITGPNLKYADGIILKQLPNQQPAYNATGSDTVSVKTDNTWEYKWDTSAVGLDTGAYTVYATSLLTNGKASGEQTLTASGKVAAKLSDSEYATVSVNLKQPFLSAVPSGTTVAKGDKIYIRGTAEGDPTSLQLYIFGPNKYLTEGINVNDDGSYEKKLDIGSDWSSNQYFVVIEHPMYNGIIDVHEGIANKGLTNEYTYLYVENVGSTTSQDSFIVAGKNKLQGSNAADALTKMIDNANIDDIYTKLTFTVQEAWIKINAPGDQAVGSTFTISGTTNLAVDDQILVEVVSSSFNAIDKTSTSTTSGFSQSTKVVAGDGNDNAWSIEVDTTNFKLDEYTIKAQGIETDVTSTVNFNLVEKVNPTVTPTATVTGGQPTTTATTAVPTDVPKTPGFGAFIALAGLGAVALLVLRRN